MAGIISSLGEKPVLFEKIKESKIPVVAGLVSSKKLIANALGLERKNLLTILSNAMKNPKPPKIVNTGECQEVIELKFLFYQHIYRLFDQFLFWAKLILPPSELII